MALFPSPVDRYSRIPPLHRSELIMRWAIFCHDSSGHVFQCGSVDFLTIFLRLIPAWAALTAGSASSSRCSLKVAARGSSFWSSQVITVSRSRSVVATDSLHLSYPPLSPRRCGEGPSLSAADSLPPSGPWRSRRGRAVSWRPSSPGTGAATRPAWPQPGWASLPLIRSPPLFPLVPAVPSPPFPDSPPR